ncbi:MAG: polysaccharide deacetylase family protein [candidate division Zixibacteria bacterium]
MKGMILSLSVLALLCGQIVAQDSAPDKEICITFDDLPIVRVHDPVKRMMMTDEILIALEEFKAPAAGFVVGDNIEGHWDILESWLAAGHILGNHTYMHSDLNDLPHKLFIEDIGRGHQAIESLLKKHKQKGRYFRYPYLHYGRNHTIKKAIIDYLDEQDYITAHVSIDTDDFVYNLQFEKLYESADSVEIIRLGNEYIDNILERLEDAEKLSQDILGRQAKHILLLHANRLNSYFLYDLLLEIETRGYKFISLDKVLTDPVYTLLESYTGPKGLSYFERLAKSDPDMLPAKE